MSKSFFRLLPALSFSCLITAVLPVSSTAQNIGVPVGNAELMVIEDKNVIDPALQTGNSIVQGLQIADLVDAPAPGPKRDELLEKRSLYGKTFDNGDRSTTLQLGPLPLHYQDGESGEWRDIDTKLLAEDGFINRTNNFPVHLPPVLGEGAPIALGPELGIRWTPGPLKVRLKNDEELVVSQPQSSEGQQVKERPNMVLYKNLYPGYDLQVTVQAGTLHLSLHTTETGIEPGIEDKGEKIKAYVLMAKLETDPALLESIQQMQNTDKKLANIPAHFGRAADDYVITLPGSPDGDIYAPQVTNDTAKAPDAEAPAKAPGQGATTHKGWRSFAPSILQSAPIRHVFKVDYFSKRLKPALEKWPYGQPKSGGTSGQGLPLRAVFTFNEKRHVDSLDTLGAARVASLTLYSLNIGKNHSVKYINDFPVAVMNHPVTPNQFLNRRAMAVVGFPLHRLESLLIADKNLKITKLALGYTNGPWKNVRAPAYSIVKDPRPRKLDHFNPEHILARRAFQRLESLEIPKKMDAYRHYNYEQSGCV